MTIVLDRPQATGTTPEIEAIVRSPAGSDSRLDRADFPRPVEPGTLLPIVDPLLFVHATAHHDLEQQRIASESRLRILTRVEADEDGVIRGFGLTEDHPDVARLAGITDALRKLEHDAELGLARALRRCALHAWIKAQIGLGEKQVARLLAATGDPYWHLAQDRPRTVSELWAYCGLHVLPVSRESLDVTSDVLHPHADGRQLGDPRHTGQRPSGTNTVHPRLAGVAASRRKGSVANWSTEAKTRAYLCAKSCIRQARSPYRTVYDRRREHTATTHPDWTLGHSHNDALRIVSKAILRDLWRQARDLHRQGEPR